MPQQRAISEIYPFDGRASLADARCEVITTSDGIRLRAAHFPPLVEPCRGSVILVQGRAEFIEKYGELIDDLRALGFAAATFDLRGQGGSDRCTQNPYRGHVDDFTAYGRDLDAVVEKVLLADCPPPYFAIGHSTGAAVLLHSQNRLRTRLERMVLCAPLMGLDNRRLERAASLVSLAMTLLGLGRLVPFWTALRPIITDDYQTLTARGKYPLTSDRTRHDQVVAFAKEHPELMAGPPTFGWIRAMAQSNAFLRRPTTARKLVIPTLIAKAVNESLVSNERIDAFAEEMRLGGVIPLDGARHEIPIEGDAIRQRFLALVDDYFNISEIGDQRRA